MSPADKTQAFRRLHESGCFVMPNAWDIGSAKLLASLGFPALATTSSGFAFTRGLPDGGVARDEMLAHIRDIVAATDLPVNADYQNCYADEPDEVAQNVALCVETGVAGLSIEDMRKDGTLYDFGRAVERVAAARAAIDASGRDVVLTARCESFLVRHDDPLGEACTRLQAFTEAGGDVLFAPGAGERDAITGVVAAVAPRPVNVIAGAAHGSVAELAALGVRRISVASGLARAAWGGFLRAARDLAEHGSFAGFADAEPSGDLNRFFVGR